MKEEKRRMMGRARKGGSEVRGVKRRGGREKEARGSMVQ